MQKNLRFLLAAAACAIGFSSCAYDPYYSSSSFGGTYSSGYGDGYGYGGSNFSTSVFVGTGDPRWGYDPYTYSYYDYYRHSYYDPYLHGYYPVGYRPQYVYGVPHPYGWHPGGGYIRPPGRVYDTRIGNYRNREYAYRNSNFDWAKQVRQRPAEQGRVQDSRFDRDNGDRPGSRVSSGRYESSSRNVGSRSDNGSRTSGSYNRQSQPQRRIEQPSRSSSRPSSGSRLPSRYNTPVSSSQARAYKSAPKQQSRYQAPPPSRKSEQRSSGNGRTEEDRGKVRGYR